MPRRRSKAAPIQPLPVAVPAPLELSTLAADCLEALRGGAFVSWLRTHAGALDDVELLIAASEARQAYLRETGFAVSCRVLVDLNLRVREHRSDELPAHNRQPSLRKRVANGDPEPRASARRKPTV